MRTAAASKSSKPRRAARISGSGYPCARQLTSSVKQLMQRNRLRYAAYALAVGISSGCSILGGGQANPKIAPPAPERPQPDVSYITPALEMMRTLPAGDPARQAELFQAAKDAAALSPTTSNKLKYALALATPGHGGSDPVAARR